MGTHPLRVLHHAADSPVHALPAHVKVVALLGYVAAVVATPRDVVWPYGVHLALLLGVIALARVPPAFLAPRMVVEVPFVMFALLLPFVAAGPTTTFLGLTVSEAGLWGAWAVLARATLGVLAALTLAATTELPDLLDGLRSLRLPRQMVEIMGFMLRYLHVVGEEWTRMRVARESRGSRATPAGWPVLARSLGVLFIRSYERGERVHLAMLSRGYAGAMPLVAGGGAGARQWVLAAAFATTAALTTAVARLA